MRLGAHALSFGWAPFWIVLAGMAAMYGPSFHDLFNGIWSTDENAHGPIVLAVALWLLYTKWNGIADEIEPAPAPMPGWTLVVASLLLYILGRSQDILIFEIGSLIPMIAGLLLVFFGRATLLRLWFPLFFMLFMIPLPGILVDAVTQPMKMGVSWAAEHLLYALGYPIARTGVILVIGQYQLLVADACAGLHSLFTLEALGLLYLNLVRHDSFARNVTLAILIVPISFCANVIRVIVLTLITYHFGDEAGQGFLHGFAGMVLFISALVLIIGVDSMLRFGVRKADAAA
ncbi:MAG: exosortase B [Pseudomonadota bacterium]